MKKITISSEKLKWFALLAMTMDHIDKIFLNTIWLSNTLGRTAFPLFSYLLISHFATHQNTKKYIIRLTIFGLLTQLCLFQYNTSNVLFTFLYAILFVALIEKACKITKSLLAQGYFAILFFLTLSPLILVADYGLEGFLSLIALYAYFKQQNKINYLAVLLSAISLNTGSSITAVCSGLATIVLLLSFVKIKNTKRLTKWWFFYVYYPLHRAFLYSLKILLGA